MTTGAGGRVMTHGAPRGLGAAHRSVRRWPAALAVSVKALGAASMAGGSDGLVTDQSVQQVQDMGLGRRASLQC